MTLLEPHVELLLNRLNVAVVVLNFMFIIIGIAKYFKWTKFIKRKYNVLIFRNNMLMNELNSK
jgi:hypothetical protein